MAKTTAKQQQKKSTSTMSRMTHQLSSTVGDSSFSRLKVTPGEKGGSGGGKGGAGGEGGAGGGLGGEGE